MLLEVFYFFLCEEKKNDVFMANYETSMTQHSEQIKLEIKLDIAPGSRSAKV